MSDIDIEKLLEPHTKDLGEIAKAAGEGKYQEVADGLATLGLTLATGNPIVGALAPFARRAVAQAFGNAADKMFRRELAAMQREDERNSFLADIDGVVAALVGQALVQIVRSQHNAKDEILEQLGGLRSDFESFRTDFEQELEQSGAAVSIDKQEVLDGAVGIRVRTSTSKRIVLKYQIVRGAGSIGIDLS